MGTIVGAAPDTGRYTVVPVAVAMEGDRLGAQLAVLKEITVLVGQGRFAAAEIMDLASASDGDTNDAAAIIETPLSRRLEDLLAELTKRRHELKIDEVTMDAAKAIFTRLANRCGQRGA